MEEDNWAVFVKTISTLEIFQMSEEPVLAENININRSPSPGTPPHDGAGGQDGREEGLQRSRGKKRHRRAKGKKKKQKTNNLMITNDDGTNSTAGASSLPQQKKVYLRPSNNPLLKAPKNSTQFIIDDHENSNLFWNFNSQRDEIDAEEATGGGNEEESVGEESNDGCGKVEDFNTAEEPKISPDDERFWTAFSERDFESVYESAHQEEIYSWNRSRILEEIAVLEKKQKKLIDMLSQIDPLVYLEKLQKELVALQEQNRQLKILNLAEREERQRRDRLSSNSSSRMPDSTTELEGEEGKDTNNDVSEDTEDDTEEDSDEGGGCSSGCCLADPCDNDLAERLRDLTDPEDNDIVEQERKSGGSLNTEAHSPSPTE